MICPTLDPLVEAALTPRIFRELADAGLLNANEGEIIQYLRDHRFSARGAVRCMQTFTETMTFVGLRKVGAR